MLDIFKDLFNKDPREFSSVEEVDLYIESRKNKKLNVEAYAAPLCTTRGSIHPIEKFDANSLIDKALF